MPEYRDKTVTMETHPQIGITQARLHPCKHSEVLKTFSNLMRENPDTTVGPHLALLIFIKFLGSVIPTIEFDTASEIHF
jgi:ubiquitin-like-conjugating enzyme ATG3